MLTSELVMERLNLVSRALVRVTRALGTRLEMDGILDLSANTEAEARFSKAPESFLSLRVFSYF